MLHWFDSPCPYDSFWRLFLFLIMPVLCIDAKQYLFSTIITLGMLVWIVMGTSPWLAARVWGTCMFATDVLLSSHAPWGVHLLATKLTIGHRPLRAAALLAVWWSCPAVNRDRLSTLLPRCIPEHMIWTTETWQMLLNEFQMVPRAGTVQGANTLAQLFGFLSGNYL